MIKQADQLWFMTHIREEEEAGLAVIKKPTEQNTDKDYSVSRTFYRGGFRNFFPAAENF